MPNTAKVRCVQGPKSNLLHFRRQPSPPGPVYFPMLGLGIRALILAAAAAATPSHTRALGLDDKHNSPGPRPLPLHPF